MPQDEKLILLIYQDRIIYGRPDKYECFIMKPYPEASVEPPHNISKGR